MKVILRKPEATLVLVTQVTADVAERVAEHYRHMSRHMSGAENWHIATEDD